MFSIAPSTTESLGPFYQTPVPPQGVEGPIINASRFFWYGSVSATDKSRTVVCSKGRLGRRAEQLVPQDALVRDGPVRKSRFHGAFVLNRRVDLHAIDAPVDFHAATNKAQGSTSPVNNGAFCAIN